MRINPIVFKNINIINNNRTYKNVSNPLNNDSFEKKEQINFKGSAIIHELKYYENLMNKIDNIVDENLPSYIEDIEKVIELPNLSEKIKRIRKEFSHYLEYEPVDLYTSEEKAKHGGKRIVKFSRYGDLLLAERRDLNDKTLYYLELENNLPRSLFIDNFKFTFHGAEGGIKAGNVSAIKYDGNKTYFYNFFDKENPTVGKLSTLFEKNILENNSKYERIINFDNNGQPSNIITHRLDGKKIKENKSYFDENEEEFYPTYDFGQYLRYVGVRLPRLNIHVS